MTSGPNAEMRMRRNPRTEHRGAMPQPFPIDLLCGPGYICPRYGRRIQCGDSRMTQKFPNDGLNSSTGAPNSIRDRQSELATHLGDLTTTATAAPGRRIHQAYPPGSPRSVSTAPSSSASGSRSVSAASSCPTRASHRSIHVASPSWWIRADEMTQGLRLPAGTAWWWPGAVDVGHSARALTFEHRMAGHQSTSVI